jgi:hypothetical protein
MSPQPISPSIIGTHERFLLYGKPKVGKTFSALTLPPPIYFMAVGADNEAKVFFSKPFQKKYGEALKREDLLIDVGTSSQQVKDMMSDAIENSLSGKGPQFASIVVDNATPLIDLHLDVALEISHMIKQESGSDISKTAQAKLEEFGAIIPHKGDWGIAQGIMRRFISDLMTVDMHMAVVAHEYELYTPGPGQTQVLSGVEPLFIGKDRTAIGNRFDNVWRMTKQAQFYIARTESGVESSGYTVVAGSRIGGVIDKDYVDPNLSEAIAEFRAYAEEVSE